MAQIRHHRKKCAVKCNSAHVQMCKLQVGHAESDILQSKVIKKFSRVTDSVFEQCMLSYVQM